MVFKRQDRDCRASRELLLRALFLVNNGMHIFSCWQTLVGCGPRDFTFPKSSGISRADAREGRSNRFCIVFASTNHFSETATAACPTDANTVKVRNTLLIARYSNQSFITLRFHFIYPARMFHIVTYIRFFLTGRVFCCLAPILVYIEQLQSISLSFAQQPFQLCPQ